MLKFQYIGHRVDLSFGGKHPHSEHNVRRTGSRVQSSFEGDVGYRYEYSFTNGKDNTKELLTAQFLFSLL